MTVREMSALPRRFSVESGPAAGHEANKNGPQQAVPFSPKAKVRGSNPLGRASQIKDLALTGQMMSVPAVSRR